MEKMKENTALTWKNLVIVLGALLVLYFVGRSCAEDAMSYESQIRDYEKVVCGYAHKVVMHQLRDTVVIYDNDGTIIGESVEGRFFYDRGYDHTVPDDIRRMRIGIYYFQDGKLVTSHSGWSNDTTLRTKAIEKLRENKVTEK